jgi:hypothetical protein
MESSQESRNGENTILQLRDFLTYNPLAERQIAVLAIPTIYVGSRSGPQPGAVAGIVLGSVAGFLLLLWFMYTRFGVGYPFGSSLTVVEEEEAVQQRSTTSRSRSRSQHETVVLETQ